MRELDAILIAMRDQLLAADADMIEEAGANCCYARSDKYWTADPQGIARETFHSLGTIPVSGAGESTNIEGACCSPESVNVSIGITPKKASSRCC